MKLARASAAAPALDLEALFDAAPEEAAIYWAAGETTVLGLGAAWQARAQGPARFAILRDATQALPAWARVFAGFAFSTGTPKALMPDAWAVLPRVLVERRGKRTRITLLSAQGGVSAADLTAALATLRRTKTVRAANDTAPRARSSDRAFCGLVDAACAQIEAQVFDKVVVHAQTRVAVEHALLAGPVLTRLADTQPSATRYAFRVDGRVFLGATPERLVRVHRGQVSADALAGSLPRAKGAGAAQLRHSPKDLAEHRITCDAIVAALRPHCRAINATGPRVRTLPHLYHLHTAVRGRLRARTHVLDLVASLHPTPAVSGAPLAAALDFLAAHEPAPRLWYAGPIGWFQPNGEGDFAVALRCALLDGHDITLYAGAGIVAGSQPQRELAEIHSKRRAMAEALGVEAALA